MPENRERRWVCCGRRRLPLGPGIAFPAAVEDAFAAVQWLAAGAGGLAIDNTRIAVSGDSAGGNLSAVVTLLARDQGPALAHQALIYPATHFRRNTASHTEFAEGYLLTAAAQDWFRDHYLNDAADRDDWRASPLLAEDHSGLPPALVITAECDPLRDKGKAYADKLAAAGGEVTYSCYPGQIHNFFNLGQFIDAAAVAVDEVASHVRKAFDA